jgi:acyl-CoA thioester hydrolase
MYSFSEKIRVRYGETDQMGYLWHGNYALYCEQARTEMLRHLGFPYSALEKMGIMMPVREMHLKYLQPARYDEVLTVTCTIKQMPAVKLIIEYTIENETGTLLCQVSTMLVFVDAASRRPLRAPQVFTDILRRFFE